MTETVRLTPREREVMWYLAKDMTTKEIADKLGISVKTVHHFRYILRDKLGVSTMAGVVREAVLYCQQAKRARGLRK